MRGAAARGYADIGGLMDRVDALPSIPVVVERVGRIVRDPRADATAVATAMRDDPALTAKVLRLINSSYFGIPGGVSDVTRAISFLGFNTIHQLVLTVSVFNMLGSRSDEDASRLFGHCLCVAGAAEAVAELTGVPEAAECFTAGLLHDLGKLALLQLAPDLLRRAIEHGERNGLGSKESEQALGIPTHDAVGLRLARRWRFPLKLQMAVGHHHDGSLAERSGVPRHLHPIVDITILANVIAHRWGEDGAPELPADVLQRLGLTSSFEDKARDRLRWKIEQSELLTEMLG